jgi:glycosyltransferase involved in cell wall biosynthesis
MLLVMEEFNPKASLIISFYNKIEILKLVLTGFERQSYKNFEVIIADDGSKPEVVVELEKIITDSKLNIRHIWHDDNGWQKNIILNKAIVASNSGYLIFIDGDCIPHRHFIKEHLNAKQLHTILAGRRVNLSERVSRFLKQKHVRFAMLETIFIPWMIFEKLLGMGSDIENAFFIRSKWLRSKINNKDRGVLGAHFSIHKSDLLAINGFDERYKAPYVGEDTDLEYRLRLNGCKVKTLKHVAILFHLHHKRMPNTKINDSIFEETKEKKIAYTPFGIINGK